MSPFQVSASLRRRRARAASLASRAAFWRSTRSWCVVKYGRLLPTNSRMFVELVVGHELRELFLELADDLVAAEHRAGADLHGRRAEQEELRRVEAGLDAADAADRDAGVRARDLHHLAQRDRPHRLARVAAGHAVALDGRHRPQRLAGRCRTTERIVLIIAMPSAPPRSAAAAGTVGLPTFGVIFAHTGIFATSFTQPTTSSTMSGFSPIAMPILRSGRPCGHEG